MLIVVTNIKCNDRRRIYATKNTSWKSALHICAWYAVYCYSSCYNSVILFLNVKTFFVVLRPGLWSAATRPCGCCIKSSLIQTRHNWGKHTSHICVAGGFMFFFSLSKSLVYIDSEMCVLAILKTNLKFALFTQVLPKKKTLSYLS